jgi:dTDP-glucose 4,6-dehydratase
MTQHVPQLRSPRNLLITGGCGFIGSAFIRCLLSDSTFDGRIVNLDLLTYAGNPENIEGVDASRYTFVHGDICDQNLVERTCNQHGVDTIVNFAAESHVDRSIVGPGVFIQTNIVGTFELLEVAKKLGQIHYHQVSTDEVYGSLGPSGCFREDSPYMPSSPYAASKAASDHLVRAFSHTYGVSVTISNCSNNYGPYQFPEKLIPLMILNMLDGKPLPVYGDGSNVRDWLHVDDHAAALWTILRLGRSGATYNIGGDAEVTNLALLHRLISIVCESTGKPVEETRKLVTFVADRPGHDKRYAIDCSKIKSELGWRRRHELDDGLKQTVAWYLENAGWIERVKTGAYRAWLETNYGAR